MKNLISFLIISTALSQVFAADLSTINTIMTSKAVVELLKESDIRTISGDTGADNALSINYLKMKDGKQTNLCFLVVELGPAPENEISINYNKCL